MMKPGILNMLKREYNKVKLPSDFQKHKIPDNLIKSEMEFIKSKKSVLPSRARMAVIAIAKERGIE